MKIIMNPPYSGNLHLKILFHLISLYPDAEVVNLSPNFYEDYKKLKNVPVAADLDIINREDAEKLFDGIQLTFNLSIQYYIKGNEDKSLLTRFIPESYKIFSKCKFTKSFKDVYAAEYDENGVFVPLKLMTACWDKNKDFIVDKLGILVDGKTSDGVFYKNKRNRNIDRPCGGIKFDNIETAKKFVEWTNSESFIAWVRAFHTNSRYILSEYPYIDDFTDLYQYFGLTPEQVSIIENEMSQIT